MKAVILAGGLGTRLSEETTLKPKPMVEIGGKPILWHILKMYHRHGISDFVICTGYMGHVIKKFFADYFINNSDVTFDMRYHTSSIHTNNAEPWKVTIVDTGAESMTGGRLLRVRQYVEGETFCLTYGDGVSDLDISGLVAFHRRHGKLATLTAVHPPGRFGVVNFHHDGETNQIETFSEKTDGQKGMINGGFFVLEPRVLDYIQEGDGTVWEKAPLENLAKDAQLCAFPHSGFWQPMDTLRDKVYLEGLWKSNRAPWKCWE